MGTARPVELVAGVDAMDVRWVTTEGIEDRPVKDLEALLEREDGFAWVDIPTPDAEATQVLSEVFGFHRWP
jgi:Mg2+ and Co2+ transporter CorA